MNDILTLVSSIENLIVSFYKKVWGEKCLYMAIDFVLKAIRSCTYDKEILVVRVS